ncbi:MAG: putative quorum-sensing-regulated virulence factor [Chlamydiota bacterium]
MNNTSTDEFICLDCETTGLDTANDSIIEVAAVRFRGDTILDTFETLVDPQRTIPPESMAIHNITQEMVSGQPLIKDILPSLMEFVGSNIIVGHAITFDLTIIANEAKKNFLACPINANRYIDTLRLARLYGESPDNSLESLRKHFNITETGAHRAMNDVVVNVKVFNYLRAKYKNAEQVLKVLSKPIAMKRMPLGKHKGRSFSDIPLPYLKWAVKQKFDRDLLFSLKQEINKRHKGTNFAQAANPFSNL